MTKEQMIASLTRYYQQRKGDPTIPIQSQQILAVVDLLDELFNKEPIAENLGIIESNQYLVEDSSGIYLDKSADNYQNLFQQTDFPEFSRIVDRDTGELIAILIERKWVLANG